MARCAPTHTTHLAHVLTPKQVLWLHRLSTANLGVWHQTPAKLSPSKLSSITLLQYLATVCQTDQTKRNKQRRQYFVCSTLYFLNIFQILDRQTFEPFWFTALDINWRGPLWCADIYEPESPGISRLLRASSGKPGSSFNSSLCILSTGLLGL